MYSSVLLGFFPSYWPIDVTPQVQDVDYEEVDVENESKPINQITPEDYDD